MGLLFWKDINDAIELSDKADSIAIKANAKISSASISVMEAKQRVDASITKNFNRKRGILLVSIARFLELYRKIMKINFVATDGIAALLEERFEVAAVNKLQVAVDLPVMKERPASEVVATLVFGGLPGLMLQDSKMEYNLAKMMRSRANVIAAQAETQVAACEIIAAKCDRMTDLLTKLNILLSKSINTSEEIISKNGYDRKNYSQSDRDKIMTCINTASAIKELLDVPVLDENGEVALQMERALATGAEYLNKMNNLISEE